MGNPVETVGVFLLHSDQYSRAERPNLLPSIEPQQATTVADSIFDTQQDRLMFEQRLKAERDHRWMMDSAREESREQEILAGKPSLSGDYSGTQQSTKELEKLALKN